jgi:protein required for attachment to host cells
VSADTTTISFDVETINVDDKEGDAQSPKATAALSLGMQAVEMPRQMSKTQGRSMSSTDPAGDLGSNKRMKKTSPKPCKPGLRSAIK